MAKIHVEETEMTTVRAVGGNRNSPPKKIKRKSFQIVDPNETVRTFILRVATLLVAVIEILWALGETAFFVIFRKDGTDPGILVIVAALCLLCCFIFVSLIVAVLFRLSWLFMPFMVGNMFVLVIFVVGQYLILADLLRGRKADMPRTAFGVFGLVACVVTKMIFYLIVFAYYRVVLKGENSMVQGVQ